MDLVNGQFAGGKHVGKRIEWVWQHDRQYLGWLSEKGLLGRTIVEALTERDDLKKALEAANRTDRITASPGIAALRTRTPYCSRLRAFHRSARGAEQMHETERRLGIEAGQFPLSNLATYGSDVLWCSPSVSRNACGVSTGDSASFNFVRCGSPDTR